MRQEPYRTPAQPGERQDCSLKKFSSRAVSKLLFHIKNHTSKILLLSQNGPLANRILQELFLCRKHLVHTMLIEPN